MGQINDRKGCTYKEFLACNPKEYDGKGGVVVYTHWIEKMESVQIEYSHIRSRGGCRADHVAYTDRFHELDRLLAHLTDEALRNGSIKKNPEKRGNGGEPSIDRKEGDDNKGAMDWKCFDK
ncbi:hypothetical protein Tco_0351184 [Tanacetum coccineum]